MQASGEGLEMYRQRVAQKFGVVVRSLFSHTLASSFRTSYLAQSSFISYWKKINAECMVS